MSVCEVGPQLRTHTRNALQAFGADQRQKCDQLRGIERLACPTAQAASLQPVGSHVSMHLQSE